MAATVTRTINVMVNKKQQQYEELYLGGQNFKYRHKASGDELTPDEFWELYYKHGNKMYA
jgi:hypothetical protein